MAFKLNYLVLTIVLVANHVLCTPFAGARVGSVQQPAKPNAKHTVFKSNLNIKQAMCSSDARK